MKLKKSVEKLKEVVEELLHGREKEVRERYALFLRSNPNINEPRIAIRWAIWHSIPLNSRKEIIDKSVPHTEWIGGYPNIKDSHLDALLKKVIPDEMLGD